jgi:NAD(P)-dependent dehydrogenase (short-subunit alcohol dehydrogenase family)
MRVNLGGALNVTQAAWPHLAARQYGRVVVLPSQGMYGSVYVAHYSASKAALFGLMRSLSLEGADVGITVNAVIPLAYTPMMEELLGSDTPIVDQGSAAFGSAAELLSADLVAPAIAWFGHHTCEVTGTAVQAGGGRVGLVFLAESPGLVDLALTPESLRDGWAAVVDRAGYSVPESFVDSLGNVMTAIARR